MIQLPLTPSERKVKRLTLKEQQALNTFTQQTYVESKLTDVEFAVKASNFLQIQGLNARHIGSARDVFDIPSNRDVAREEKARTFQKETDLAPIEKRLLSLEGQVRKLFALSDSITSNKMPPDAVIIRIRDELYHTHSTESGDFRAIELVRRVLKGEF